MRRALGLLALTAAIALGSCGDDDTAAAGVGNAPGTTAAVSGDDGSDAAGDAAAVSCESGDGGSATVDIEDFRFQPDEVTVAAGETVTWVNRDGTTHSVWSDERTPGEREWESVGTDPSARAPENLAERDAATCTFATPGTYAYLCGIHNTMVATVVVT